MTDATKRPVILVVDDDLAGGWSKNKVVRAISAVAEALGYDEAQRALVLEHVRFFVQYNEDDGPLKAEECAAHYITDRNDGAEEPILAFVDNRFYTRPTWANHHGIQIISALRETADARGEMRPAIVWVSSDPAPQNIAAADKDHLEGDVAKVPAETILELAKRPYDKKYAKSYDDKSYQVLIHSLRDAFERIAGGPVKQPWKTRIDPSTGGTPLSGPG